jgi:hypothetical protein
MKSFLLIVIAVLTANAVVAQQGGIGFGVISTKYLQADGWNAPVYQHAYGLNVTVLYKIKLDPYKKLSFAYSTIFKDYDDKTTIIGFATITRYDLETSLTWFALRPMMEYTFRPDAALHFGIGCQGGYLISKCIKGIITQSGQTLNEPIRYVDECGVSHDHKFDFRIATEVGYDFNFGKRHAVFISIIPSLGIIENESFDVQFQLGYLFNEGA